MSEKNVAIVTEAGNGLGKQFAGILKDNQYEVILATDSAYYKKLSDEELEANSFRLFEVDFTSEESLKNLLNTITDIYGKLDVLINNAEIVNGFGHKIDQLKIEDIKKLYDINFFSVIRMIQVFKPLLEHSTNPKIINITSALGDITKMKDESFCYAGYGLIGYSTSKAALNMFTQLQCREFKPSKIKIYSFDPVLMKNCTHNSVMICDGIKDEFVSLIR